MQPLPLLTRAPQSQDFGEWTSGKSYSLKVFSRYGTNLLAIHIPSVDIRSLDCYSKPSVEPQTGPR